MVDGGPGQDSGASGTTRMTWRERGCHTTLSAVSDEASAAEG
jgi:hypothetical protein